jgi:carbonic anhydrase
MSVTDELLKRAEAYAEGFGERELARPPAKRVAIVACMDARLVPTRLFGLREGDAHVIRNAGGAVTDDVIRSLAVSQWRLGTREVVLVHHTDCGMLTFTDDEFRRQLHEQTGVAPPWAVETFTDLDADLRRSIARVRTSPFLPHTTSVRGFVFDVETGGLREVEERG